MKPYKVSAAQARKNTPKDASLLLGHTNREDFEAAVAEGAVSYTASRFLGRGVYDTRPAATLEEARQHAQAMGADRVMIYAINAQGRSTLIEAGGKPVKPGQ